MHRIIRSNIGSCLAALVVVAACWPAMAVPTAPNDPALKDNLALWLRGDILTKSSGVLQTWNDLSGNGRDGSTVNNPTVSDSAAFNNRQVVNFNGSNTAVLVDHYLYPASRDLTVITVAATNTGASGSSSVGDRLWTIKRENTLNSTAIAYGQQGSDAAVIYRDTGASFQTPSTSTALPVNQAVISSLTQNTSGTNLLIHQDSTQILNESPFNFTTEVSDAGNTNDRSNFWVGAQAPGTDRHWDGQVAEVIVYDRVLSASEREGVERYLANRYNVAVNLSDSLTDITTKNDSGFTNLTSITTEQRGKIPANQLLDTDVFHWHPASGGNSVIYPGAVDPGTGMRAANLAEDLALNTGMINPGDAGTLTIGEQAALGPNNNSTNGLGVMFGRNGLVNGPGIDLVVFEIHNPGEQDHFRVNRIDGVMQDLIVAPGDYSLTGANQTTNLVNASGGSLISFEGGPWSASTNPTVNQPWIAAGIDLSDLGYSLGQIAPGLLFSDAPGTGNIDITMIAALPLQVDVPEPTTALLLPLTAVALLRRRSA